MARDLGPDDERLNIILYIVWQFCIITAGSLIKNVGKGLMLKSENLRGQSFFI